MNKEFEPTHDIHEPQKKLPEESTFIQSLPKSNIYNGTHSGGKEGSTGIMKLTALNNGRLLNIFFFFFPFPLFEKLQSRQSTIPMKKLLLNVKDMTVMENKTRKERISHMNQLI